MCKFFSFVMDETGKKYYFDWPARQSDFDGADSHDHICEVNKINKDRTSCYEYNPLTKDFVVDWVGSVDNRVAAEKWVRKLDFKKIVPALIVKPIVNPFDLPKQTVTEDHIALLRQWATVRATVRATAWDMVRDMVRDMVGATVGDTVGATVWDTAWDMVRDMARATVRDTVRDTTVRDTVWDTAWDTVWDTAWAYISSFFAIKYDFDFTPCVTLWESGIVPSFDGTTWRLHSGKNADVIYETKEL